MVQRGQNLSGRFVKLIEYGTGMGKRILVIPEGWRGSGWAGLVRNMRVMVGSSSSSSTHVNRVDSKHGTVSYASTLLKLAPVIESYGYGNERKVELVSKERLRKEGPMTECHRNSYVGGATGWSFEVLHRLGEVEGSLWHIRSELFGWREKLDIMLEKVDGGLGLIMGLGHVSVVSKR